MRGAAQVLIDQLNSLGTGEPLTVRQLEDNMRDASLSPMIVMLLRMLASAEIQRRGDFFYPFILARRGPGVLSCMQGCEDAACAVASMETQLAPAWRASVGKCCSGLLFRAC